jgi:hypothetical protein
MYSRNHYPPYSATDAEHHMAASLLMVSLDHETALIGQWTRRHTGRLIGRAFEKPMTRSPSFSRPELINPPVRKGSTGRAGL